MTIFTTVKEFAKSAALLVVIITVYFGTWLYLVFSINSSAYGLGGSSFESIAASLLWIIGPFTIVIFLIRSIRLYRNRDRRLVLASVAPLLVYIIFVGITATGFFTSAAFNIFDRYTAIGISKMGQYRNERIAVATEVTPTIMCIARGRLRGTLKGKADGDSDISLYDGTVTWEGLITFPKDTVSIESTLKPFNKNDPSMSEGTQSLGRMSVETIEGSGNFDTIDAQYSALQSDLSSTTFSSDGRPHTWKISGGIDLQTDFAALEYQTSTTGSSLARAYELSINLRNGREMGKQIYSVIIPDDLYVALLTNSKQTPAEIQQTSQICQSM